jgi:hypothetical protein
MKNAVVIIIGSVISMLIIVQVLFLVYADKPEALGVVLQESVAAAPVDTVKISSVPKVTELKKDSSTTVKTTKKPDEPVPAEVKKPKLVAEAHFDAPIIDSVDWKAKAKYFEAMNIEDATRIIKSMKDEEVRAILDKLKKRTAAKILASLDPQRAANILR